MVIRLITILALFVSFAGNALTQLTATVDKNPVMTNESFMLQVVADDKVNPSALHTDTLLKDFIVGQILPSSQTQIINTDVQSYTIWTIQLTAKGPGRYQIPAFTISNVSSNPIAIKVENSSNAGNGKPREVFVETSVDSDNVYLQSSITYTTKLYLSLEFQRGSLTEPKMDNANIVQISSKQDEESSKLRNGVRYRVYTRVFSITPQRSGTYDITPPLFNGELVINRRRSIFSGFNSTKPVSVVGQKIKVTVQPIPSNYVGQWLPSEKVALNEEWQPDGKEYKVGDPITRIITLTAIGVAEEQLPEIKVNYPDSVKTYPDQSTLNSATRNNKLVSQRKDSIAIVPGKPGKLTLPEVKIPWWNTKTNSIEYATLPQRIIDVKPAAGKPQAAPSVPTAPVATAAGPAKVVTEIKEVPVNGWLTWGFLAGWIVTLLLWFVHVSYIKRGQKAKPQTSDSPVATSGKTYWRQLEAACKNGDTAKASAELLRWGRARWPEQKLNSNADLARYLGSAEVKREIDRLQRALYGSAETDWTGQALLAVLAANKDKRTQVPKTALTPLHPA